MAEMYLKVNADFGNLIKLKQKIDELTTKLQGMDKAANPKEFKQVEKQLQQFTEEFNRVAHSAAIANKEAERTKQSIKSSTSYLDLFPKTMQKKDDKSDFERQYMHDTIKEYIKSQEDKLKITQEFDKKIAEAQDENQKKTLENQKKSSLSDIDNTLRNNLISLPNELGVMTEMLDKELKDLLAKLKNYVNTDEFKTSPTSNKKITYETIQKLNNATKSGDGTLNFKTISQKMNELETATDKFIIATKNQALALDNQKKAQDEYEKAINTNNEETIKSAKQSRDSADIAAKASAEAYKEAQNNVENLHLSLQNTTSQTASGLSTIGTGLKELASKELPKIFTGFQNTLIGLSKLNIGEKAGKVVSNLSEKFASGGIIGQIISAVLSILEVLKDGIGTLISGIIDTALNAVNGVLKDILSGDIVLKIVDSVKYGTSKILNTISFGGFNSLVNFINGGNAKEVRKNIERLTTRNETLSKCIDRLTNAINKEAGGKSLTAYNQAYTYQKEKNSNLLQIAREQAGYHRSHKSWNKRMNWTNDQIQWAQQNVDKNFNGTDSLWNLTPEQMSKLLSNDSIYEQIINAGKGDYGKRVMEKLEAYANQNGNLDKLTDKINESLMQISFDGLRSNFLTSLMDMDKDAKSFTEDFSQYMQRALMNFALGELFDEDLKKWYNGIAKLMKDQNGKLTTDQLNDARTEYEKIGQQAIDKRNEIATITGYKSKKSSSQQSTKGAYQSMSQDTGDKLEARNTAIHMTTERMDNKLLTISNDVRDIRNHLLDVNEPIKQSSSQIVEAKSGDNNKVTLPDDMLKMNDSSMKASELIKESFQQMVDLKLGNNTITQSSNMLEMNDQIMKMSELTLDNFQHMEEIRNIQLNSYYVLKDINKNTQELYQMNERLGQMNDKLSRL